MVRGIRSVAFPSISTGIYRFSAELAAKIVVKIVNRFLEYNSKSWCKSVSAFANTFGGALIFGVADDGQEVVLMIKI